MMNGFDLHHGALQLTFRVMNVCLGSFELFMQRFEAVLDGFGGFVKTAVFILHPFDLSPGGGGLLRELVELGVERSFAIS